MAFSFEDGSAFGGTLLFEEPADVLKFRRYRRFARFVFAGLVSAVMVSLAVLVPNGLSLFAPIWILLGLLWVGALVELRKELQVFGPITGFRVYENGISVGQGRQPYRPIEAVYSLEETTSTKHRAPFAVLTFSDGTEAGISKRGLGRPVVVLTKDYERTVGMLRGLMDRVPFPSMPWEETAIAFVEQLSELRGVTKIRIEKVAKSKGVEKVDLQFIAANWLEIADNDGVRWRQFRRVARKEFGDTSVEMSPQL